MSSSLPFLPEQLPAGPRRQAGEGSEIVGEMALIGKACLHGGLCRGDTPFQQAPCLADPHRHQIAVGRDALGLGKGPDQGGFAQSRLKAELLQRDMPGIVAPDERTGPLHLHPAGRNRFHHPGVPRQQEAPGQQQRLLPPELRREEALLLAWGLLLPGYAGMVETVSACRVEVERTCAFIRSHYARHITLEELSLQAGLSKSALVRAFAKAKGVTPYRYLMAVRISEARRLLERGVSSAEAAVETGFSDQSHFTNYFTAFTGLTPGACRELFRQEWERG